MPRSVAMKISGHRTESIYRRYAIVAERDIADGLRKVAAFQRRVNSGTSRGQSGIPRVPRSSQVVEGDGGLGRNRTADTRIFSLNGAPGPRVAIRRNVLEPL